ncbi:MAG: DUF1566 domain-containing protein [Desulfuromonadaceae bacterium]|nr:DUF1566 domain-containing protein [Desulfuromonadaceae bacterium]
MCTTKVIVTGFMLTACLLGCSYNSALEGKVVDGKGQPMAGVKVIAKQIQKTTPLEATTGADGKFRFEKLYAASEYELIPYLDATAKSRSLKIESAPKGKTMILPQPLLVLFVPAKDGLLVRDLSTGLLWARDAAIGGRMDWDAAMAKAKQFNFAGFSDWRLPTKNELRSLASYGGKTPAVNLNNDAFTNVQTGCYWSSDSNDANTLFAWAVNMTDGKIVNDNKTNSKYSVWFVRSEK